MATYANYDRYAPTGVDGFGLKFVKGENVSALTPHIMDRIDLTITNVREEIDR